jgi:hypothetical protein
VSDVGDHDGRSCHIILIEREREREREREGGREGERERERKSNYIIDIAE